MPTARRLASFAVAAAALCCLAAAPVQAASPYDIFIYRVTDVSIDVRTDFAVDGVPPRDGDALDLLLTDTARLRGTTGGFRIGPTGRNVAFFRPGAITRKGTLTFRAREGTFVRTGNWTITTNRVHTDDADNEYVVTQTSSGVCNGSLRASLAFEGAFRRRGPRLANELRATRFPDAAECQRGPERSPAFITTTMPFGLTAVRMRSTLVVPISYRRTFRSAEDGATVVEAIAWSGRITLRRVKVCPYRRGLNQFGCAGYNADSL